MTDIRSFIGSRCPACANDILQPAPETNRMPQKDRLTCPACTTSFRLSDLLGTQKPRGFLGRLFGPKPETA
jgi:hypothetical protein